MLRIVVLAAITALPLPAQTTWLASRTPSGNPGNGAIDWPDSVSADGRFVAFASSASDLVPNDTNGVEDVFVFDRQTAAVTRVSETAAGVQGNGPSSDPSISADGALVAFSSLATNLIPGNPANVGQIYRKNRNSGTLTPVSAIRTLAGTTIWGDGHSRWPAISADGAVIAFSTMTGGWSETDTNGAEDVYAFTGPTIGPRLASMSTAGLIGNGHSYLPRISSNGQVIAFTSRASNLAPGDTNGRFDVFVRNRFTGTTTLVSARDGTTLPGNGDSQLPDLSADGRLVVFESSAADLTLGDSNGVRDVFLRDTVTSQTIVVSVGSSNQQAIGGVSGDAYISDDGNYIAFSSGATNLGGYGVRCYVRDRIRGTTWSADHGRTALEVTISTGISADGLTITYAFNASSPAVYQTYARTWQMPALVEPYGAPCLSSAGGCNVVPAAQRTRLAGDSAARLPLSAGPGRYQQVLRGSDLPSGFPISGLGFRQAAGFADGGGTVELEVRIGYTTHDAATLTTNFASNFNAGPPVVVMPRRTLTLPNMPANPPGDPTATIADLPFVQPFQWQPAGLNLPVEVIEYTAAPFDYHIDAGTNLDTAILVGTSPTAATGTVTRGAGAAICLRSATNAPPVLSAFGQAQPGWLLTLVTRQCPRQVPAVLLIGASDTNWGGLSLPLPLAFFGAPGCQLLASGEVSISSAANGLGTATYFLNIPNLPGLVDTRLYLQSAAMDARTNALGLAFSQGLRVRIGSH